MAIQIFIVDAWKTYLHAPRPFWVYDNIVSAKCYTQFGNPSGHSISAAYFAMYVYFMYVAEQSDYEYQFSEDDDGNRIKMKNLFVNKQKGSIKYTERVPRIQYGTNNRFCFLNRIQDLGSVQKKIIFVILASIVLLMGLSRMILGVHFLDQVIFGFLLGFLTLAFVKEVIWPLYTDHIQANKEGKIKSK